MNPMEISLVVLAVIAGLTIIYALIAEELKPLYDVEDEEPEQSPAKQAGFDSVYTVDQLESIKKSYFAQLTENHHLMKAEIGDEELKYIWDIKVNFLFARVTIIKQCMEFFQGNEFMTTLENHLTDVNREIATIGEDRTF